MPADRPNTHSAPARATSLPLNGKPAAGGSRPLPRELANAPDWLLDDVGQSRQPRPAAPIEEFFPWMYLVRRLG